MKKIGFIGYGSMSSMLVSKMLKHNTVKQENVQIFSRSRHQGVMQFKNDFPGVILADSAPSLARECDIIFVCLEPFDIKDLLNEIKNELDETKHLISIAAGITTEQIASLVSAQVTKLMPSLLAEVDSGVTLLVHRDNVGKNEKQYLESLISPFTTAKVIKEEDIEAATNLTGSAPAYIAAIFQDFIEATVRQSNLAERDAFDLTLEALEGTAKLLKEKQMTFSETINRVATKGGISEEGVNILHQHLPEAFDELVEKTLYKYETFKKEVVKQ